MKPEVFDFVIAAFESMKIDFCINHLEIWLYLLIIIIYYYTTTNNNSVYAPI